MENQTDHQAASDPSPQERFDALPPEDRRRISMALRFLTNLKRLHVSGMEISADLLEGKVPAEDIAMRLFDLEHDLRIAASHLTSYPLEVVHKDALRTGQTKLDDDAWMKQMRFKASQSRAERAEIARQERLNAPAVFKGHVASDEDEPEGGMRP